MAIKIKTKTTRDYYARQRQRVKDEIRGLNEQIDNLQEQIARLRDVKAEKQLLLADLEADLGTAVDDYDRINSQ